MIFQWFGAGRHAYIQGLLDGTPHAGATFTIWSDTMFGDGHYLLMWGANRQHVAEGTPVGRAVAEAWRGWGLSRGTKPYMYPNDSNGARWLVPWAYRPRHGDRIELHRVTPVIEENRVFVSSGITYPNGVWIG